MFGIFDGIQKTVENAVDVGLGVVTLGEYGNVNKKTISKLIADGIEIAVIAAALDTTVDIIEKIIEEE